MVLLYLNSPDFEFGNIASIILSTLSSAGITVITVKYWDTPYHHGYFTNPFYKLVEETYRDTRSELFLFTRRAVITLSLINCWVHSYCLLYVFFLIKDKNIIFPTYGNGIY